jgi:4-hydroxybenzoate polyprenyltransferase
VIAQSRWYIYQRERFPLVGNGALILAFASGAVCFSAQLRASVADTRSTVATSSIFVAFISSLLFFFQLRVADEHKDLADDTRWRPYRPVPRGLVTLRELRTLGIAAMGIQAALAFMLSPQLVAVLLLVWGYMWLMAREFWAHDYLRARPVMTLWTHMLIIPLIDLYATACDWTIAPNSPSSFRIGLVWFLLASFFNGMVVEIGRKLRAPEDEEEGVETYTRVWGRARAVLAWLVVMAVTAAFAILAAAHVQSSRTVALALGAVFIASSVAGASLVSSPKRGRGKHLEALAGLWTVALYLTVGVVPFLTRS